MIFEFEADAAISEGVGFFLMMKQIERLILRRYKRDEKPLLAKLLSDPGVMRFVDEGEILSEDQITHLWYRIHEVNYVENKIGVWAVFTEPDNRYIGHAAIKPRPEKTDEWEIVYYLVKAEWGKGFGTEIAKKIIEFGFNELNLEDIYATVDEKNQASIRVLEKAGMKFSRFEFDEIGRFSVYEIRKN